MRRDLTDPASSPAPDRPLRRVLITSSYYWPEGAGTAPYVTGLAEHLSVRGYDVEVSTTFAHYPAWRRLPLLPLGTSERRAGVHVRRRWLYVPGRQSSLERAAYEGSMFTLGATALPLRRPNVVLTFIPSVAAATLGALAGRVYRRPYGLIVHDLVGPGARQSGMAGERVSRAVSRVEFAAARAAAGVAIIAEGFRRYFDDFGGIPADRSCGRGRSPSPRSTRAPRPGSWAGGKTSSSPCTQATWDSSKGSTTCSTPPCHRGDEHGWY